MDIDLQVLHFIPLSPNGTKEIHIEVYIGYFTQIDILKYMWKRPPVSASAAEATILRSVLYSTRIGTLGILEGIEGMLRKDSC